MNIQENTGSKEETDNMESTFQLWSATPTPLDEDLKLDFPSVGRMIDHHVALGVNGLMLGGTCGEGSWIPFDELVDLVKHAAEHNARRIGIAVQVTDNSASRMLAHIDRMAAAGADYAVVAAPYFMMNATPERIFNIYHETIEKSALPVVCYDRGAGDRYQLTDEQWPEILALGNLVMIKDSSCSAEKAAIRREAQRKRSGLTILCGDEFGMTDAVINGMNGGFLGGAIFNAPLVFSIFDDLRAGELERARTTQQEMNEMMYTVYGGTSITAWLTGEKYLMQKLGVFSSTASYLEYPLSDEVRAGIDALFEEPLRARFIEPLLAGTRGGG